jgi:hypothetical protein
MGQEVETKATIGGKSQAGRVQLETDYLLWRGKERLKIPFATMRSVVARGGRLRIEHQGGKISFELGPRAERWADKIRHPPTVLDKLGVKPGQRVSVIGDGGAFSDEVAAVTGEKPSSRARKGSDLVLLFASDLHDLARIDKLRGMIVPDGAVWVIYPKGRKEMTENDVLAAGRAAAMKDVKVVRFSDSHTGLKMVIPVSDRKRV